MMNSNVCECLGIFRGFFLRENLNSVFLGFWEIERG